MVLCSHSHVEDVPGLDRPAGLSHTILNEDISMPRERDPMRIAVSVCVYAVTFWAGQSVFYWVLSWFGALAGTVLSTVAVALFTNWLMLRVYENRGLTAIGLAANRAAAGNAAVGLAGGIGAA